MSLLRGRRIAGKAWRVTPGIAQINAVAFTVSLSSSSGLSGVPVTVTVAPVGGVWAPSQTFGFVVSGLAGTFSATSVIATTGSVAPLSVTFTPVGSAPASGTINATSSGLTNQSGAQAYSVVSASATGYTMTQPNGSGFVGQVNPITLVPTPSNSVWPGGTITLTASGVAGAFAPSATVTPIAGSSTPVSVNWTPSATGTATISATNAGGFTNPPPLIFSVSAVSGSSATLTVNPSFDTRRVFNRDVYAGNPPGFSTTYGKGWGAVSVSVTPSQGGATGMWVRLHDALDPRAIPGSPGTGTVLQSAVQVAGVTSLNSSANTVNLTIPAGLVFFYADLALRPDMSNAVRVPTPFGVGSVTFATGTSHMESFMNPFQYDPLAVPPVSQMVNISPFGVIYAPNNAYVSPQPATLSSWDAPGDVAGAGNNPANDTKISIYNSPAVAEYLRLCVQRLGVVCAVVAAAAGGGKVTDWNPDDLSQHRWYTCNEVLNKCGYKFDAFLSIQGANEYFFDYSRAFIMRWLRDVELATMDASAAAPFASVLCTTPLWLSDGSTGFRQGMLANRDIAAARPNTIDCRWFDSGCVGSNITQSHTTPMGRIRFARNFYRDAMGLLGPAKGGFTLRKGPQIVSATRAGRVITCTVQHDGGTALVPYTWLETNPATCIAMTDGTATGQQLGILFAVYLSGNSHNYADNAFLLALDSSSPVTIVNATTIQVQLAADPGNSAALDLWYGTDMWGQWPTLGQPVPSIKDNTSDGDGLPYGRDMRRTIDPVFVVPPTPAAQAIAVNAPIDTAAGAWIMLGGPSGTGLPLGAGAGTENETDLIEVAIGGGAYVSAKALVRNDNAWGAMVQAPATVGAGTAIAVRRAGQSSPDASTTFNVVTARNTLPSSIRASAQAMYDASNIGTMWQDTAMTVPAAQLQPVRAWQDALGTSSNTVFQTNPDAHFAPFLDKRIRNEAGAVPNYRDDLSAPRPCLNFYHPSGAPISGSSRGRFLACKNPALASLTGDCTILAVCRWYALDGGAFGLGRVGAAPDYAGNGLTGGGMAIAGGLGLARAGATSGFAQAAAAGLGNERLDFMVGRYTASSGLIQVSKKGGATAAATLSDTSASTYDTLIIGATFGLYVPSFQTVRLYELTFFNVVASDPQVNDLLAYAQTKWGIS